MVQPEEEGRGQGLRSVDQSNMGDSRGVVTMRGADYISRKNALESDAIW